jgi:hypothetical protein
MRFRPLSGNPFTDIGRTIPEFRSVGLTESKEFNCFSVDKKDVFEIDGEAARFLLEYAPKHVDMFPCNPAAYEQHNEVFSAGHAVDSAAHFVCFRFTPSIRSYRSEVATSSKRKQNACHLQVIENTTEMAMNCGLAPVQTREFREFRESHEPEFLESAKGADARAAKEQRNSFRLWAASPSPRPSCASSSEGTFSRI